MMSSDDFYEELDPRTGEPLQNISDKIDTNTATTATSSATATTITTTNQNVIVKQFTNNTLNGEDRKYGGDELCIDMIPSSCWFTNVRYCIAEDDWDILRRAVYKRADYKCEICKKSNVRLEAHEKWSFDKIKEIQKLERIICLCNLCHGTAHFGYSKRIGREKEIRDHMKKINKWDDCQIDDNFTRALDLCGKRANKSWHLDLSIITDSGFKVVNPVDKDTRKYIANDLLYQNMIQKESSELSVIYANLKKLSEKNAIDQFYLYYTNKLPNYDIEEIDSHLTPNEQIQDEINKKILKYKNLKFKCKDGRYTISKNVKVKINADTKDKLNRDLKGNVYLIMSNVTPGSKKVKLQTACNVIMVDVNVLENCELAFAQVKEYKFAENETRNIMLHNYAEFANLYGVKYLKHIIPDRKSIFAIN